jgi:succinate dehydrogenase / fumarate reductase cytochrome b subunit
MKRKIYFLKVQCFLHIALHFLISLFLQNPSYNLYAEMQETFEHLWVVIVYLVGVVALAWHLLHGFPSAFQTLGINNSKYNGIIKMLGTAFSIVVPLLFALMPIALHFHWLN